MSVFGKKKRFKRVHPQKVRLPVQSASRQAPPIPQKRLKVAIGLAAVAGLVCIIHANRLGGLFSSGTWYPVAATAFVLLFLSWAFWAYMSRFQREVLASVKKFLLVGVVVLGTVLTARALTWIDPGSLPVNPAYLIPLAFSSLTLTIVFNPRFALFVAGYMAICTALVLSFPVFPPRLPAGIPEGISVSSAPGVFPIIIVLLFGALTASISVGRIRNRSKPIKVGAGVGIVQALMIVSAELLGGRTFSSLHSLSWLYSDPLWGLLSGLMVGFLVSGALPFIEYLFDVTTDISLIELSDHNHPLLRRLLLEAPGTYHHSFITGTLSESAAEAIGANSLLARVGGYFHDIGKMNKPEYFTENETQKGSHHARLSPTMSTLIIIAHTKDGIEIAKDFNLPPAIIDFIPQHHGTSVIEYFYREAVEQSGGRYEVRQDCFRHLGPKPQTRETAIVSLADSVEAASRSLADPTPARLSGLVHGIITHKLMDDQLDESGLTFRELKMIEDTFLRVLAGIFHGRIAYPEAKAEKAGMPHGRS